MTSMRLAIVLCGRICSGKSSLARSITIGSGIRPVSFGAYFRYLADRQGALHNRSSLQDIGQSYIERYGARSLLEDTLRFYSIGSGDAVLFDGVRHVNMWSEIEKYSSQMVGIWLQADQIIRHRRYEERLGHRVELRDFLVMDGHPVEAETERLTQYCQYSIDSTRDVREVATVAFKLLAPYLKHS